MANPEVIPPTDRPERRRSRRPTPLGGAGDPLELLLSHLQGLVRVDAAVFLVVDSERTRIEPAAQWFASAAIHEAIEPALRRPYDREVPGLVEVALERGRPLLLPRIEDWEAAPTLVAQFERHAGSEDTARLWEIFRGASVIACPVRTPIGHSLGVLVVASADPERPLRKRDLRLIEVLSALAALALERSQLLAAEAARGRQEMLLKRASEGISGSLESEEVYARVVEHAVRLTRADHGLLSRLMPGSSRLIAAASSGRASEVSMEAGVLGEVARTRAACLRDNTMHAPVALGPRLFGVLSVARDEGPAFDEEVLDLLQRLARIAAASIANAIDFERERRIARALTRGFVPESLPETPGYDLGLLYEPADSKPTGGDLYGVWSLPSGQVALLVGDVAGKGVETAALSAMARFFIEARSWDCDRPGTVLAQANTMLASRLPADTFVTAFFALLTPDCVHYANAGHLPPVVLRADQRVEQAGCQDLPLGIEESSSYEDCRIEFAPGDLMVGFTDGLVEARRAGELFGDKRLQEAIAKASGTAPDLDSLVRMLYDDVHRWAGGLSDDAVALAVRRRAS
ncbi:MAG: PP2C family protein-serine/threonine phosphatase [Thermoleophilaceae bacterium]